MAHLWPCLVARAIVGCCNERSARATDNLWNRRHGMRLPVLGPGSLWSRTDQRRERGDGQHLREVREVKTRPSVSRTTGPSVSFTRVQPMPANTVSRGIPPSRADSSCNRLNLSALSRAVPPSLAPPCTPAGRGACRSGHRRQMRCRRDEHTKAGLNVPLAVAPGPNKVQTVVGEQRLDSVLDQVPPTRRRCV